MKILRAVARLVPPYVGIAVLAASATAAGPDCQAFEGFSDLQGSRVPGYQSEREVIGQGRLYFHSSPYPKCRLPKLFIVPGDKVTAYVEFAGFTAVMYLNKKTGDDAMGWVDSARLRVTGRGVSPRP